MPEDCCCATEKIAFNSILCLLFLSDMFFKNKKKTYNKDVLGLKGKVLVGGDCGRASARTHARAVHGELQTVGRTILEWFVKDCIPFEGLHMEQGSRRDRLLQTDHSSPLPIFLGSSLVSAHHAPAYMRKNQV